MQSPFPGMDPFLESQEWEDFHTTADDGVLRERSEAPRSNRITWFESNGVFIWNPSAANRKRCAGPILRW
jgi:hypothetical protein